MPKKDGASNLVPLTERSKEEHSAIARKGAMAAHESKIMRKTFKEALEWALDLPAIAGNADVEKVRKRFPDITNRDAMAISLAAQAIRKRDVRAFVAARDTTGELPMQTVNVENQTPLTIRIETVGVKNAPDE